MPAQATPAQTRNLFLLEDVEDVSRTSELAEGDLDALRSIAEDDLSSAAGRARRGAQRTPACKLIRGSEGEPVTASAMASSSPATELNQLSQTQTFSLRWS
jgi:hypothetical protein